MRLILPRRGGRDFVSKARLALQGMGAFACVSMVFVGVRLFSAPVGVPALAELDEITMEDAGTPRSVVTRPTTDGFAKSPSELKLSASRQSPAGDEIRWFNGRPIRPVRTIMMQVTAYSPDERSCAGSADGITASGYTVWTNGFKSVAADPRVLPLGSMVSVPGYDAASVVPVLDVGGAIKGNRLDVLFPLHAEAKKWGSQRLPVVEWKYADGKPNGFKTAHR